MVTESLLTVADVATGLEIIVGGLLLRLAISTVETTDSKAGVESDAFFSSFTTKFCWSLRSCSFNDVSHSVNLA